MTARLCPWGCRTDSTHTHFSDSSFIGAIAPSRGPDATRQKPAGSPHMGTEGTGSDEATAAPARAALMPAPKGQAAVDGREGGWGLSRGTGR